MSDTSISTVIAAAFADEAEAADDTGASGATGPGKVAAGALDKGAPDITCPTGTVEAKASDPKPPYVSKKRADNSKSDSVLKKLRSARGVTVGQMMESTGWQAHSVRGFLSAVVRKKLGLTLMSEVGKDGQRRYRVVGADAGTGQRG